MLKEAFMSHSFYFMFDARTALLDRNVAVQYFVNCFCPLFLQCVSCTVRVDRPPCVHSLDVAYFYRF